MAGNTLVFYLKLMLGTVVFVFLALQGSEWYFKNRVSKLYGKAQWGYWKKPKAKEPISWIITK